MPRPLLPVSIDGCPSWSKVASPAWGVAARAMAATGTGIDVAAAAYALVVGGSYLSGDAQRRADRPESNGCWPGCRQRRGRTDDVKAWARHGAGSPWQHQARPHTPTDGLFYCSLPSCFSLFLVPARSVKCRGASAVAMRRQAMAAIPGQAAGGGVGKSGPTR